MNHSTPSPTGPDANCCPICGQPNQCAMQLEKQTGIQQAPCWCASVDFTAALLERIPQEARGLACVCATCAKEASL